MENPSGLVLLSKSTVTLKRVKTDPHGDSRESDGSSKRSEA